MISQEQLLQIQTVPISDGRNGIYYLTEGYFKCRPCGLYIKCGKNRCPFCNQRMSRRIRTAKGRNRLIEFLKNPIKPEPVKHTCSGCGSSKTKMRINPNRKNGKEYPAWYKDGSAGFLCCNCYWRKRRNEKKLKLTTPER